MPFDGNGVFLRVMNWTNDALSGIKIRADRHDDEDNNLANGLSQCITRDGQSVVTGDIPLGGFKLTQVGNATVATDAVNLGQVASGSLAYYEATGVANTYAISFSLTGFTYVKGQTFKVKIPVTNTGASTLNVSVQGAKSIKRQDGTDPTAGELPAGAIMDFTYNGTNFIAEELPGQLNGTPMGGITPSTGAFTNLTRNAYQASANVYDTPIPNTDLNNAANLVPGDYFVPAGTYTNAWPGANGGFWMLKVERAATAFNGTLITNRGTQTAIGIAGSYPSATLQVYRRVLSAGVWTPWEIVTPVIRTYAPNFTPGTNVTSCANVLMRYVIWGNIFLLWGNFTVTNTASTGNSALTFDRPPEATYTITNDGDIAGYANGTGRSMSNVVVNSDIASQKIRVSWVATTAAAQSCAVNCIGILT